MTTSDLEGLQASYQSVANQMAAIIEHIDGLPDSLRIFSSGQQRLQLKSALDDAVAALKLRLQFLDQLKLAPWPESFTAEQLRSFREQLDLYAVDLEPPLSQMLMCVHPSYVSTGTSVGSVLRITEGMRTNLLELNKRFKGILPIYKQIVDSGDLPVARVGDADAFITRWAERLQAAEFLQEAREARDKTVQVLDHAKQAAGETGAMALGGWFQTYAKTERVWADILRAGVILCLLTLVVFAATIVPRLVSSTEGLSTILARLSFSIPLAVLAGYLSRESSRHRQVARWAKAVEVQLLTFDAFAAPLTDLQRQNLRMEFGRRIFGASTLSSDADSTLVSDAASLLGKMPLSANGSNKSSA